MSSNRHCCVPGCIGSRDQHQVLHVFPNPEKEKERFNTWLHGIGGDILSLENKFIFKYRRVCDFHFEQKYKCRFNKISKIAVPTLNMPSLFSKNVMTFYEERPPLLQITNFEQPSTSSDVPIQYEPVPSTSTASAPPPPNNVPELAPPSCKSAHAYSLPTHNTGPTPPCHTSGALTSDTLADTGAPPELNNDLLEILGEDPSQAVLYGKDIQSDLSVRLQQIATSGLTKETRKELLDRYLVPGNCSLIGAPLLNPEVKAAISEAVLRKDKAIELKQKQLASATSCVAEALTILMSAEVKDTTIIKLLMDTCKILCDSQNTDSNTRRSFVQLNIKKELKEQLSATRIDNFLFSNELAETLKTPKAISKSGANMKISSARQPTKITTSKLSQKQLNWKIPPQNYRSKGNRRVKDPVLKTLHEISSKRSSRAAQTFNRNKR